MPQYHTSPNKARLPPTRSHLTPLLGPFSFKLPQALNTMSGACPLQHTVNQNFDSNYFTAGMSFKPPL